MNSDSRRGLDLNGFLNLEKEPPVKKDGAEGDPEEITPGPEEIIGGPSEIIGGEENEG